MIAHVVEVFHTWQSGETGVTVKPAMVTERLVRSKASGGLVWVRSDEFSADLHEVYVPPAKTVAATPTIRPGQVFRSSSQHVSLETLTERPTTATVRPGEARMMTLLPSPTLEPDAQPVTISYDEALLAWRHHRWPDCRMTDRP